MFPCGFFHATTQGEEVLGWHHISSCLLGRSCMLHVGKAMHVHKNVRTQKMCDASKSMALLLGAHHIRVYLKQIIR